MTPGRAHSDRPSRTFGTATEEARTKDGRGPAEPLRDLAARQFADADNMTDALAALSCLVEVEGPESEQALAAFYERWQDEPLVLDKWLAVQAGADRPDTLERVRALLNHPKFAWTNPNQIRNLLGTWSARNPAQFHAREGEGYAFLVDCIKTLDGKNPQVAAQIFTPLNAWQRLTPALGALMRAQVVRLCETPGLSRNVFELASKSLA